MEVAKCPLQDRQGWHWQTPASDSPCRSQLENPNTSRGIISWGRGGGGVRTRLELFRWSECSLKSATQETTERESAVPVCISLGPGVGGHHRNFFVSKFSGLECWGMHDVDGASGVNVDADAVAECNPAP